MQGRVYKLHTYLVYSSTLFRLRKHPQPGPLLFSLSIIAIIIIIHENPIPLPRQAASSNVTVSAYVLNQSIEANIVIFRPDIA